MTMTEEKTRDDILNEEIEAEHAEAERRNNTTVEYEIASDEESKMFEENMKNKNIYPIETVLTIKLVDFIDITEFNNQSISGGDYENKRSEFLKEHKRFVPEVKQELIDFLKSKGFVLTSIQEQGRKYDPFIGMLEQLKDSLCCPSSMKDLLDKIK